ncbi:transposon-encoded TnpW family protein [Lacrimispora sp. JR3]|uniref:transposon-encoded TnpW family protein n=1 Tax=Lacrimispora sinapis TaxID=3111456 RepID=UPI003749E430
MNCNRMKLFFEKICRLFKSKKGTWEQEESGKRPALCYIIGGIKYLVNSYFKEDATLSAEDKINRLIERDIENNQNKE